MHIQNLEPGLRRAMTAVFRQQGLSEAQASAKVAKHLQAASDVFHAKCKEGPLMAKSLRGPAAAAFRGGPAPFEHAMREVVRWAHSLR